MAVGEAIGDAFVRIGADMKGFDDGMESVKKTLGNVGGAIAGFVAKAAAIAGAYVGVRKVFSEFSQYQDAVQGLTSALTVQGDAVAELMPKYKDFADGIQKTTTYGDEAVLSLMTQMRNLGVMPSKLEAATKGAIGLAEALGMDASSTAKYIALAEQGEYTMLQRYIPALRGVEDETQKQAILQDMMNKGFMQAEQNVDTLSGRWKQFQNAMGDVAKEIGQTITEGLGLQDVLKWCTEWVQRFADWIQRLRENGDFVRLAEAVTLFGNNVRTTFEEAWAAIKGFFQGVVDWAKWAWEEMGVQLVNIFVTVKGKMLDVMNWIREKMKLDPIVNDWRAALVEGPNAPAALWDTVSKEINKATAAGLDRQQEITRTFAEKQKDFWKKEGKDIADNAAKPLADVAQKTQDLRAGFSFELPHLTDRQVALWGQFLAMLKDKKASVAIDIKLPTITTRLVELWGQFFKNIASTFGLGEVTSQGGGAGGKTLAISVGVSLPAMSNHLVGIWKKFFDMLKDLKDKINVVVDIKLPHLTNSQVGLWKKFFDAFKDVKGGVNLGDVGKAPAAAAQAGANMEAGIKQLNTYAKQAELDRATMIKHLASIDNKLPVAVFA